MPAPEMSSQLEKTSAILGEYMLKGWTLTDLHCDGCRSTPLMREPLSQAEREHRPPIQFCALCDGSPTPPRPVPTSHLGAPSSSSAPYGQPSSSIADGEKQSDDLASSISTLLLQGYSLLGTNCPNPGCRSIPLVGYPRKREGPRDGRRMCVSCGGRWVDESDLAGMKVVGPAQRAGGSGSSDERSGSRAGQMGFKTDGGPPGRTTAGGSGRKSEEESPRSRKRRELYDYGAAVMGQSRESSEQAGIRERDGAEDTDMEMGVEGIAPLLASGTGDPTTREVQRKVPGGDTSLPAALSSATSSLSLTLSRLATSLQSHTLGREGDEPRYFVDVKLHTEAMRDVLEVLRMVEKLGGGN